MKEKLIIHGHSYALLVENKLIAFAHPEDFNNENVIGKLSIKNCQAIANGYDLDELVSEAYKKHAVNDDKLTLDEQIQRSGGFHVGYKEGAKAILEILGDKKFSEEDIREAMDKISAPSYSRGLGITANFRERNKFINNYIQSLQQTEWEVEVEMEIYDDPNFVVDLTKEMRLTPKILHKPKLDSDGCLILKRV